VLDAQFCQLEVCTRAVLKYIHFILYTVPVALSADSKLVRNSVLLLLELLDIQVVTG